MKRRFLALVMASAMLAAPAAHGIDRPAYKRAYVYLYDMPVAMLIATDD